MQRAETDQDQQEFKQQSNELKEDIANLTARRDVPSRASAPMRIS